MMALYQVAVKQNDQVVFTSTEEAGTPNEAIEQARKHAQLHYNNAEAYDAYDESPEAQPLLKKVVIG